MRISRVVLAAITTLGLSVGIAGPAAADGYFVAGPKKVVVNQSYETISWRLAGAYGVDSVDATLEHVTTREVSDFDFAYYAPFSGQFKFYSWERMGRYQVYGESYDTDFYESPVSPAYVTIKRAAVVNLSAARNGRKVTLTAKTKRFNGGYPTWVNHRNAKVRFQRLAGGTWRTFATRTVPSNGVNKITFRAGKRSYRAVVAETATVWSDASPKRTR